VAAGGPHYGSRLDVDADARRYAVREQLTPELEIARYPLGKMRAGGMLAFMSANSGRVARRGLGILTATTAASPVHRAARARARPGGVNLIAGGFVDAPCRHRCSETG
jgi:hypothetical protein